MSLRTKSWLLVKTLGFFTDVYWHIHPDYDSEKTLSGSFKSESEAREICALAIKHAKVPKTAVVKRSLCFWSCAEHLSPGWEVAKVVIADGFRITFIIDAEGTYCILDRDENGTPVNHHVGCGKTLSEAVCAAALKSKGLLIQ